MTASGDTERSGVHPVTLGSSFDQSSSSNLEQYLSLRYNFQPGTLDTSVSPTLSGGLANGSGEYSLIVRSKGSNMGHLFKGPQVQQKEVDCLLIWDESSNTYRLERLASAIRLEHQRNQVTVPAENNSQVRSSTSNTGIGKAIDKEQKPSDRPSKRVELPRRQSLRNGTQDNFKCSRNDAVIKLEDDDDEEEDGELEDLANMLVSTLDEQKSASKQTRIHSRDDESSEDED